MKLTTKSSLNLLFELQPIQGEKTFSTSSPKAVSPSSFFEPFMFSGRYTYESLTHTTTTSSSSESCNKGKLKANETKRPTERGRRVEDLNRGHRREALGVGRLSRRRHSSTEGRPWVRIGSCVARQVKGVILNEPGSASGRPRLAKRKEDVCGRCLYWASSL